MKSWWVECPVVLGFRIMTPDDLPFDRVVNMAIESAHEYTHEALTSRLAAVCFVAIKESLRDTISVEGYE